MGLTKNKDMKVSPKTPMGKAVTGLQKRRQANDAAMKELMNSNEVEGEVIAEKQKDTPDQVAAVIDMYRSKKGTDEADKDSMEGKKKDAKKERDYAKFKRDKMARDAQKSGHPFMHAKGSTTEKEGKKSVKMAPVKDSYEPSEFVQKLVESGKFSEQEIAKIIEVDENI